MTEVREQLPPLAQNLLFLLWSKVTGSGQAFVSDLKGKIEARRFVPVIDRRYALAAIADAYRYVQTGEKAGVVVIDIVTEARASERG